MIFQRFYSSFRRASTRYNYFNNHKSSSGNKFLRSKSAVYMAAGFTVFGSGYYLSHLEKVPFSHRTRFMSVTTDEEETMARASYNQTINQFRTRLLPHAHPYHLMVSRVSRRIIKVSGLEDLRWDINVISKDDEMNAFVLPGGKIFVFTGLLRVVNGNEDQLAAVIGHEVAHLLARHGAEKMSLYKLAFYFNFLMKFVMDTSFIFNDLLLSIGVMLPFSRKCESEADYIGLLLVAQACYDPRQAIPFWKKMEQVHKGQGTQLLSTHPLPEKRIEQIEKWLPEAVNRYHASDCDSYMFDLDRMFTDIGSKIRW